MEWITVYISGKPGFKEEVQKNIESSRFPIMPGASESDSLSLFWIDDRASLRDLKKAIGSKTVFKYRLQFYSSIEKYLDTQKRDNTITLTPQEKELVNQMSAWQANRKHYKISA